jgi:type VI secretion system protein ImpK
MQLDEDISFVTHFFEEFHGKVLKHLNDVNTMLSNVESAYDEIPGDADAANIAQTQTILNDLYDTLERQALLSAQKGGEFAVSYYREAQYVMAALADELFLTEQWPGKLYWKENLLETRLFGTHDAGDVFFARLDDFLEKRDALRRDVAEVYLLALGLGFKGKFRDMPDQRQLDFYRHELYVFINHTEPRLYQGQEHLFANAYSHTLTDGTAKQFQDVRFWTGAIASLFSGLLLISFILWHSLTSDVETVADTIVKNKVIDH